MITAKERYLAQEPKCWASAALVHIPGVAAWWLSTTAYQCLSPSQSGLARRVASRASTGSELAKDCGRQQSAPDHGRPLVRSCTYVWNPQAHQLKLASGLLSLQSVTLSTLALQIKHRQITLSHVADRRSCKFARVVNISIRPAATRHPVDKS